MIIHLFYLLEKHGPFSVTAFIGMFAGRLLAQGDMTGGWGSLWKEGGMALVMVVATFILARMTLPKIAEWITKYLTGLEERNAATQARWEKRMDDSQDKFLLALSAERAARERFEATINTALTAQKDATVDAIKENSQHVLDLIEVVKGNK
jgi:hypothetical protein